MKRRKAQSSIWVPGHLLSWFIALGSLPVSAQPANLRHQAEMWMKRGNEEFRPHNNPRAAFRYYQQSLSLARQLKDPHLIGLGLSNLRDVCLSLGKFDDALSMAEEALSLARQAGDRRGEARALDDLGDVYYHLDDYDKALKAFQAALPMMREMGDQHGEAGTLKNLGATWKTLARFDEALEALHGSLRIYRQLDAKPNISSALVNLGAVYASIGESGLALEYYQQGLQVAQEIQNIALVQSALIRMGYLNLELNEPARAYQYFTRVFEEIAQKGLIVEQAWVLRGISIALYKLGRWEEAVHAQQQILNLKRQMKDEAYVGAALLGLGYLYLERDPQIAASYFRQALKVLSRYDSPFVFSAYAGLAGARRRQGNLSDAIENYDKALGRLASVRGRISLAHQKSTFLEEHQGVYQEFIETLMERQEREPKREDDIRAFSILERSRARAVVESIAEARLDIKPLEPDVGSREVELSARIAKLQKGLTRSGVTLKERQQILDNLNQAEEDFDILAVEMRRHDPRYAALKYPDAISLGRAQALLDPSSILLAYLTTENHIFAFLLTCRDFHVVRLKVSSEAVSTRVQNYVDLITQGYATGWQQISRRLYADLFGPISKYFPPEITHLIIIPDGALHYLPFETLLIQTQRPNGGERGKMSKAEGQSSAPDSLLVSGLLAPRSSPSLHYLVEDFAISYAPSATVLAELCAEKPTVAASERADCLVFANPTLRTVDPSTSQQARERTRALYDDEGLKIPPIPFSANEVKAIRRFINLKSEVYTGSEASEHRLKTERLDLFRILHFACHGLISQRMPARSALVLASGDDTEDGFLQAREIYKLRLKSDLVVLSGCQTGRGRILFGEGVQGLAQAFLYAGADSVVASLWNVNDERTATFMSTFYRYLADGQSKAKALRGAKLDMLKERDTAAPRYWAPFILIGEGDRAVPISGPSWWIRSWRWLLIGFALSLTVSGTLFLVKKKASGG